MSTPPYDHPAVCSTYFFPMPGDPLPAGEDGGPLELRLADGTRIGAYWARSLRRAPTLLYLHGNGECVADQLDHWPTWAREAGANALFVDYPGYATSGGEPTFSSCREAALAALDHLLAQPEDEVPAVIVAGRSVGSIFALDAAARRAAAPRLRGLLLESGVGDLVQRLEVRAPYFGDAVDLAALSAAVRRDFDHQDKLARLRCPLLVLHTRGDSLIPCWHAERLAEWAGERLHELLIFERGDHNTIQWLNGVRYRAALREFVAHCTS